MLTRYWHTLRYLRPVQLYGRLWFRLYRPKPDLRPAPGLRLTAGHWERPLARQETMLGPATFRFLNETHDATGQGAWNDPARDKLWLYNLHYFDDLGAGGDAGLAGGPPGAGELAVTGDPGCLAGLQSSESRLSAGHGASRDRILKRRARRSRFHR